MSKTLRDKPRGGCRRATWTPRSVLVFLCPASNAGINPMACQQTTHTHTSIHTHKRNSHANRQASAPKPVRMFVHQHRGRSVRPVRTSALYQDDGRADGHQNSRLISAAKHVQETFSPHEWGTESTLSGKLSVKVSLIIKHSPWTALFFIQSNLANRNKKKKKKMKCALLTAASCSPNSLIHIFKHR